MVFLFPVGGSVDVDDRRDVAAEERGSSPSESDEQIENTLAEEEIVAVDCP